MRAVLARSRGDAILWVIREPTRRGVRPLVAQIRRVFLKASRKMIREQWHLVLPVTVGAPGRYVLGSLGIKVVAPRSAENIGRTPHEFDRVPFTHS